MRKILIFIFIFFAGVAEGAQGYYGITKSTTQGQARMRIAGRVEVAASSTAIQIPAIVLHGPNNRLSVRDGAQVSTMTEFGFYGDIIEVSTMTVSTITVTWLSVSSITATGDIETTGGYFRGDGIYILRISSIAVNAVYPSAVSADTYSNITLPAANVAAGSLSVSVIASSIAVNAVYDGAVTNDITLDNITQITARAVSDTTGDIAANRIGGGSLNSDVIVSSIAVGAITGSEQITNGIVSNDDLAGSIADSKLNQITTNDKVTTSAIATGLLPSDVISSSVAANAIESENILDGEILNADINVSAAIAATKIADGSVSDTEFQYINSLTSNAQTQFNNVATDTTTLQSNIDGKVAKAGDTMTGNLIFDNSQVWLTTGAYNTIFNAGNQVSSFTYTLPVLDGNVADGYVLSISTNGEMIWTAPPVSGVENYYFTDENSDLAEHYVMYSSNTLSTISTVTYNSLSDGTTLLGRWVTNTGFPLTRDIIAGAWDIKVYAAKTSGNKNIRMFGVITVHKSGGSEVVISTAGFSNEVQSVTKLYNIITSTIDIKLETGDRIEVAGYAYVYGSGASPDLEVYFGGTSPSNVSIPASNLTPQVVALQNDVTDLGTSTATLEANKVPYSGATGEVDLGSYGLNTSSDVVANAYYGDGSNLTNLEAPDIADGSVSDAEFQRLDGLTADIQGQIDGKEAADVTIVKEADLTANDFDVASNVVSLDYVNGQKATSGQNGFLSSTDWTTFNNKVGTESDPVYTGDEAYNITSSSTTDWNTAYSDRMKWDGGATGLTAATGRASLDVPTRTGGDASGTWGISINGNAGTATALAADPTDCTLPNVALGVNANGTAQCSQPSDVTGNAATASALASDPAACSAGQYVLDIDADGTLTCGTPSGAGDAVLSATQTWTGENTFEGDTDMAVVEIATLTVSNPIAGVENLIYSTTTASTVTDFTISNLDYGKYHYFNMTIIAKNALDSEVSLHLFVNGDTTATNYWAQRIIANSTGSSGERSNDGNITPMFNLSTNIITCKIMIAGERLNTICSSIKSHNTNIVMLYGSRSLNTVETTNITSITLHTGTANAFSSGSKIILTGMLK